MMTDMANIERSQKIKIAKVIGGHRLVGENENSYCAYDQRGYDICILRGFVFLYKVKSKKERQALGTSSFEMLNTDKRIFLETLQPVSNIYISFFFKYVNKNRHKWQRDGSRNTIG